MNQGKVGLREISSQKFEVSYTEKDDWVRSALERSAPHPEITGKTPEEWAKDAKCRGSIRIERLDPEYNLEGNFDARVEVLCPHCGEAGTSPRADSFRLFIRAVSTHEEYEKGDDPDYLFLETPWVDLAEVLSEQIVAAEPVVEYPDQNPDGTPHKCDETVAQAYLSTGQNEEKAGSSPFAVLKDLKVKESPKRGK